MKPWPMLRRVLAGMVVSMAVLAGAVGVLRAVAAPVAAMHDVHLRALFAGGAGCAQTAGPCALGLLPGTSTRADALAVLGAHPWVGQIYETSQALSWKWSGEQPAAIDPLFDGVVGFSRPARAADDEGALVMLVRFGVQAGFGDAWLAFGRPLQAQLVRPVSFSTAYQIAGYGEPFSNARAGTQAITTLGCRRSYRADVRAFWDATVTLGFGELWTTELINGAIFDVYTRPGWWDRVRHCRPQPR